MPYVEFSGKGYRYLNDSDCFLFSSDNTHNYLFDYINTDLLRLSELIIQYVSIKIDNKTLEINQLTPEDYKNIDDALNEIIKILKSIHPYYEHEAGKIIINEIGSYFIELSLIYSKHNDPVSEKCFDKIILHLMPPSLLKGNGYPNKFYEKYLELMGKTKYMLTNDTNKIEMFEEESLLSTLPEKPMKSEIEKQETICDMLYSILDIDAQGLETLTISQRIWFYSKIHQHDRHLSRAFIKKQLLYGCHEEAHNPEEDSIFSFLHSLNNYDVWRTGIPIDMMDNYNSAIKYAEQLAEDAVYEKYKIDSLQDLLYLEIMNMAQSGIMIRKCKNCGRYFVVSNRKIMYCERKTESGRPCSAIGPIQSFQKKMKNDEAWKLYSRAYNTHYNRVKRAKGKKSMTKEEFSLWCDEAKKMLQQVWDGKLDVSNYEDWLKN